MGCSSEDSPNEPLVASYFFSYMHYPTDTSFSTSESNQVRITYKNHRITKRQGGVRGIDSSTGFGGWYSSEISDTVIYSRQKILVEEGRVLPYYTEPSSRTEFILDPQQRIMQRINVNANVIYQSHMDTTKYSYTPSGLLYQSRKGKPNLEHEVETFYYDSHDNLVAIITKHYGYGTLLYYTVKETFSEYDDAPNPLKQFFLFKETFLRSLSKNNYMHYEKTQYDYDQNVVAHEERHWVVPHYQGHILFALY